MSKENLLTISPDLTVPGFTVKVENSHFCKVKSQDGRYEFSFQINESKQHLKISGNMLSRPHEFWVGTWKWRDTVFNTDADDVILQVANSLKLMDKLSSEGFSAKIKEEWLVLSHPSKPDYELRMSISDARKICSLTNSFLYTGIKYCGPAYDEKSNTNTKWKLGGWAIDNFRLIVTNKDFEELAQELKTRVLSLGEEKDPRITQWVSEEIENALTPQGFTFTPKPEDGIVEFLHPTGLSGSLSFALFTAGPLDLNPKYPNLQFPTDIEKAKVVSFTCYLPSCQEPYLKGWVDKPDEVINGIRGLLALELVYQNVCKAWKSDILIPKLKGRCLHLVNTKLEGDKAIIFYLTPDDNKLFLKGMGYELFYPILDTPSVVNTKAITQIIVDRADRHVHEFIQEYGLTSKVIEVEF
jgi:hypothetical protein